MPWVGFEPTIPASERAKTVHALDRASTVIGMFTDTSSNWREVKTIGQFCMDKQPILRIHCSLLLHALKIKY
jgi:hypothetical protein